MVTTVKILDSDTVRQHTGAVFRRTRQGPERQLVQTFLEKKPFLVPHGCNATIFCEPRIESGFPDLVIVLWDVTVAQTWNHDRSKLTKEDIRLVHYLHLTEPLSSSVLRQRLSRSVVSNLDRLEAADLIYRVNDLWRPRSIEKSFAARRIIAIEAKICQWARAINQAFQNTWFASESFVLLPMEKPVAKICASAQSLGVQLCSPGKQLSYKAKISSRNFPRSYASWLFNEWAWKASQS
jgi:hypothetical protein